MKFRWGDHFFPQSCAEKYDIIAFQKIKKLKYIEYYRYKVYTIHYNYLKQFKQLYENVHVEHNIIITCTVWNK